MEHYSAIREQIKSFPASSGLYFIKDAKGTVLYIGKAKNLRSRAASYFQPSADIEKSRGAKIAEMLKKAVSIDYLQTNDEVEAVLQEARLIKDIRPPYNSDLTDDKTFPYLEITLEDYPAVYITRKPAPKSRLFGPFANVGELRAAAIELQKIFKFRTCRLEISQHDEKRKFFRPCLLYSIKQCTAPCADKISRIDYREIINGLLKFMKSDREGFIAHLAEQMKDASQRREYEKAAVYRDQKRLLENLAKRGSVEKDIQPEIFQIETADALEKLQKIINCANPVRVIEGFDIAHISGCEAAGALVRFIDARPFKAGYRRYKIKTAKACDDYAALQEVLSRRFKPASAGEELWPDLILIDGGLGQLHAAQDAFKQLKVNPPMIVSLAKKEEIIYIVGKDEPLKLAANNPAKKLLQSVRDEAHRFAQHYHHILRQKKMLPQN